MMNQINLNLSKKLFNDAYYPDLFDYSCRYQVFYGGAGSGKSHYIFQKLIIKGLKQQRKILVIRKVARTLKDSCFQMTLDTLSKFKILPLCKINYSTFTIELPNGTQFLYKGLDDSEKIKSIAGITDIIIEEATEITLDEFTQLDLRLRAKKENLQIYLMFNPVSKVNWCYKYWFEGGTPANTAILKTTYKDNRFLPIDYVNALERLKETNYTYWNIYANGEFCSLDKLVYTNWRICADEPPSTLPLLIGIDFGYINDASAMIVSRIDEDNKKIYIIDEMYQHGLLNDAIANEIKYRGYAKEIIIADSAEQKSIAEIKREGIPRIRAAVKGQGSILQGIQKLQQYELLVNPACTNTIVELQNYSWQKEKISGEYINKPQDSFNHCLDALRYSLQCVENKTRLTAISKGALGL